MSITDGRIRRRTVPNPKGLVTFGKWQFLSNSVWKDGFTVSFAPTDPFRRVQVTEDRKNPGPPYLQGGPFTSVTADLQAFQLQGHGVYNTPTPITINGINAFWRYVGGFGNPVFDGIGPSNSLLASETYLLKNLEVVPDMIPWYTQVDRTLRPRLAKANLAQFAYELREAPRMIKQSAMDFHDLWSSLGPDRRKFMSPKRAADSFLNDQFGWQPFIRDVQDLCKAALFAKEFFLELQRMNNTWTKRRGVISETESDSLLAQGTSRMITPAGGIYDQLLVPSASWTYRHSYRKRVKTRIWATGEYKFYRPEFDTSLLSYSSPVAEVQRYITLFGARVSPSVIWKVTPWTWLIDWFVSIGSLLESLDAIALDGVVSKNLYLMQRTETIYLLQQEINFLSGARTFEFERNLTSKQRAVAGTPFGFGLTGGLSARQYAILAALGLSKRG